MFGVLKFSTTLLVKSNHYRFRLSIEFFTALV